MYKRYTKLETAPQYDQEAAEELAEVVNEIRVLDNRLSDLKELVDENSELRKYLWTTADGVTIAFHKLEDSHLKNILQHQVNYDRQITKELKAEARKRGFEIPTQRGVIIDGPYEKKRKELVEGDVLDDWFES